MNKFIQRLKLYINDFIGLFYPEFCVTCNSKLVTQEKVICTACLYKIPRTHFHKTPGNPVEQSFWGRQQIERATAYFFFKKASIYQKLLHQLKYHNRSDIGIEMGRQFGAELMKSDDFMAIDYIVPVPLHKKKLRKRGYNQSDLIAEGMSEFLNAKLDTDILKRSAFTETQTKKGRYERWENVEKVFICANPQKTENKHVLIVDDVLTTGATIEGCAQVLHSAANVKISVATLAYAAI